MCGAIGFECTIGACWWYVCGTQIVKGMDGNMAAPGRRAVHFDRF